MGVRKLENVTPAMYEAVIHIQGNYIIGRYPDAATAAIAYNKAADHLHAKGIGRNYVRNYIYSYSARQYKAVYEQIHISNKILNYPASPSEKGIEE